MITNSKAPEIFATATAIGGGTMAALESYLSVAATLSGLILSVLSTAFLIWTWHNKIGKHARFKEFVSDRRDRREADDKPDSQG